MHSLLTRARNRLERLADGSSECCYFVGMVVDAAMPHGKMVGCRKVRHQINNKVANVPQRQQARRTSLRGARA